MMVPKFRAWEEIYKTYIDGVLIDCNGKVYFDDGVATQNDLDISVERSTGMKDANGNMIYEGDILEFGSVWLNGDESDPQEEDHTGIVEYHPEYASYVVNCNETIYPLEQMTSFDGYSVRGNVHENPELLEADK